MIKTKVIEINEKEINGVILNNEIKVGTFKSNEITKEEYKKVFNLWKNKFKTEKKFKQFINQINENSNIINFKDINGNFNNNFTIQD